MTIKVALKRVRAILAREESRCRDERLGTLIGVDTSPDAVKRREAARKRDAKRLGPLYHVVTETLSGAEVRACTELFRKGGAACI